MFGKNLLMKIVSAILALGAVTTMAFYADGGSSNWFEGFPGTIFQEDISLPEGLETLEPDSPNLPTEPAAPEITDQKKENECGTQLWWYDNEKYEDNVFFYRRVVGVTGFVPFKVTGPHAGGPGSFGEANLPNGTYEYQVSVVNEKGEAFSNISLPITIDSDFCNDNTLPNKPLNPVIVSLERFNDNTCSIRINYQDNSLDEDGIRIYRETAPNADLPMIAELPSSNAPTGFYDDMDLPPGIYRYRVSVFNEGGESFSQYSDEFPIQDEDCKGNGPPTIALPTLDPTVDLPSGAANACVWTSSLNVFIRKGPSSTLFADITAVVAGTSFPVVGQSEDGNFWVVEVEPGRNGYVPKSDKFGSTTGDCNPPTLPDPEAPAPAATEEPASQQIPACRDGLDNDGDGYVDMRDRECASPEDTSE